MYKPLNEEKEPVLLFQFKALKTWPAVGRKLSTKETSSAPDKATSPAPTTEGATSRSKPAAEIGACWVLTCKSPDNNTRGSNASTFELKVASRRSVVTVSMRFLLMALPDLACLKRGKAPSAASERGKFPH